MKDAYNIWRRETEHIQAAGLYKNEYIMTAAQSTAVQIKDGGELINMCANNYLGLANNPEVIKAAEESLKKWGYGLSSVRFICGTQQIHIDLEKKISEFLKTEDTILYSSCFDANGGLFECLLGAEDAVISDELNHASIIDGVRLCKAARYRYKNNDMQDLESKLKEADAAGTRIKLIVTDGVFSMDGIIADLRTLCDLADKYDAVVAVDDSHAVGVIGENGRGSHEYNGVMERIDIITGTLGKALGGASGGYASGRREITDILRQRSRPYLFSNTLSPTIAAASIKVLEILSASNDLKNKLDENTSFFRAGMQAAGFNITTGVHPIVPVMLGDELIAQKMGSLLLEKGILAVGFFYPVVPKGKARIRTQVSAAHTKSDLEFAINAFIEARKEMGI